MDKPIEIPFEMWTQGGPVNRVLGRDPDLPPRKEHFRIRYTQRYSQGAAAMRLPVVITAANCR